MFAELNIHLNNNRILSSILKVILFLIILFLTSCKSNPDFGKLRSEILELHQENINAHLNKNVDFFVKNLAKEFMEVKNGEITQPDKKEIEVRIKNYLDNTTFIEYRDLKQPIIGFSEDGSFGWSIVQVKVSGKKLNADGIKRDIDFTCAWITLYKRYGNNWLKVTEVSNFR